MDQGFPQGGEAAGILFGPVQQQFARRLHRDVQDWIIALSNVYTSLCQASEWGMRGLQGTFPRCKKRLPSDSFRRMQVIEAIVYMNDSFGGPSSSTQKS